MVLLVCWVVPVRGQYFYHDRHLAAGVGGGPLLLFGDIGNMGVGYGAGVRLEKALGNEWLARLQLVYGMAADSDEGTPNASRGYEYNTAMQMVWVQGEYLFYRKVVQDYTRRGLLHYWNRWQAGLVAGPGILHYKVSPGGRLTEEVMSRSSGYAALVAAGVEITYGISGSLAFRGEISPVFLFSDHVDGYASPHSRSDDFMYRASVSVIYTISP